MALFGIGWVKEWVLDTRRLHAGLEALLMGGAAAGVAFLKIIPRARCYRSPGTWRFCAVYRRPLP